MPALAASRRLSLFQMDWKYRVSPFEEQKQANLRCRVVGSPFGVLQNADCHLE